MKVPLSWLRDYVDISLSGEAMVHRLTMAGLEVAKVIPFQAHWDRIVVGQVVEMGNLIEVPAADPESEPKRFIVIQISDGQKVIPTVAGAFNVQAGDKVPLALPRARYVNPADPQRQEVVLEPAEVHGIWSEGMACSERELRISDEHEGILILKPDLPVGVPLAEALPDVVLEDTILDLDLTPNLSRCFSMIGVAREVAALTGQKLRVQTPRMVAEGLPIEGQVEIEITDPDLCFRYCAALIRGVCIGPSPLWMKQRLWLAGMRSINNIVDVTNYVMLEWGQPLHAFDYDWLRGRDEVAGPPLIVVRRAWPGEEMTTLDKEKRQLEPDMLLITDGGGPVALAGVMGGLESEVKDKTTNVLVESASFYYINNRRTSKALKLESESSQRFSRGVPPAMTIPGVTRATELMRELGGGTIARGIVDVYPIKQEQRIVDITPAEVERILGMDLGADQIVGILEALEFVCQREGETIHATVPDHRLDVAVAADLIEELARVVGYEEIPTTLMRDDLPPQRRNLALEGEERVRDILVGCGLTEVITYSLTNPKVIAALTPGSDEDHVNPNDYVRLDHPLSRERVYMRHTLMASLLETVRDSLRFADTVAIFEVGRVYLPRPDELLPAEPRRLSIAMTGPRTSPSWLAGDPERLGFYDLKGVVEALAAHLSLDQVGFVPARHPTFQPGRVAALRLGDMDVGMLGEVHPGVREEFDLPAQPVCLAEFDLERLLDEARFVRLLQPIPRVPATHQDLAIVVDETVPAARVREIITMSGGDLLKGVVLFDLYRGGSIPAGKKSLTFSLSFQTLQDTLLEDKDVKPVREQILHTLETELGATLRV